MIDQDYDAIHDRELNNYLDQFDEAPVAFVIDPDAKHDQKIFDSMSLYQMLEADRRRFFRVQNCPAEGSM